jgi:putative FmdB family regulatory protein
MPTYQYHCKKCDKEFELYQSMSDKALTSCPKDRCRKKTWGKGTVQRVIGAGAGLIFKGSGFYITDYRSENYKESAKKETSATTTAKPDAGKSDKPSKSSPSGASPAAKSEKPAKDSSKS